MSIFAIGDTHLSGAVPHKSMDVFGEHWHNHWQKIKTDWTTRVTDSDTVLIVGDISWAMKFSDAIVDLNAIAEMPGKKIIIRGNHDYWWQTLNKMNKTFDGRLTFLHNTFSSADDYAVCGSRGWLCPGDTYFTATDNPIYLSELQRAATSLDAAVAAGHSKIILMLHFPPTHAFGQPCGFTELFERYPIEICVFGHLHALPDPSVYNAVVGNTVCHLVACDALDFRLKKIV